MAISSLFIGSDLDVAYSGASIASTGAYLNSGTCTWVLKDGAGTTVGSGTLTYVGASNGNYAGTIESTVTSTLEENGLYTLTITFVQTSYNDERDIAMYASYRGAT